MSVQQFDDDGIRVMKDNAEATAAWDGPLFDVWFRFRSVIEASLQPLSEKAFETHPPPVGGRCLDVGCGLGDTTFRLGELIGPGGFAYGVDVAPRMIEVANEDLARSGATNVEFAVADVENSDLGESYDYAFGRCGVMFFAHPVPAFRNICAHLVPGGEICLIVWRRKIDNDWVYRTEQVVQRHLEHPEESDVPTCGPGPFAMANADTVTEQLSYGGFEDITLTRHDFDYRIGGGLDEAVELNMSLGPAAEILRQWGDRIDEIRPTIEADIRATLSECVDDDGTVRAGGSVWIISARKPV